MLFYFSKDKYANKSSKDLKDLIEQYKESETDLLQFDFNKIEKAREVGFIIFKVAEHLTLLKDELAEKEAIIKAVDWINEIMEYKDFSDYIGEGVYLTISGITDVISNDEKDCYTTKTIPPEKIKIVLLKNKITGEIIDSRENILTYFMSITPIESIIESTHNVVTIKVIKELYNKKINDIACYNSNNFEIEEVPICMYLVNNKENNKNVSNYRCKEL